MTHHERDMRDLRLLQLLDQGFTQDQACKHVGCSRGPLARLLADIRLDERREVAR